MSLSANKHLIGDRQDAPNVGPTVCLLPDCLLPDRRLVQEEIHKQNLL